MTEHVVVIGATQVADDLRRACIGCGIHPSGVTSRLQGLRRGLVRGDYDLVVLCISMDDRTLERYGRALRTLLDDQQAFTGRVRSVGLLGDRPLDARAASMGCHVYVSTAAEACEAVKLFISVAHGRAVATLPSWQASRFAWMGETAVPNSNESLKDPVRQLDAIEDRLIVRNTRTGSRKRKSPAKRTGLGGQPTG